MSVVKSLLTMQFVDISAVRWYNVVFNFLSILFTFQSNDFHSRLTDDCSKFSINFRLVILQRIATLFHVASLESRFLLWEHKH